MEDRLHEDHAVTLLASRDALKLSLGIGHNGDGPWMAIVMLGGEGDEDTLRGAHSVVHASLGAAGATDLRWYDAELHGRGATHEPWPNPFDRT